MANQWLRLWHDMPNDPKWRTIARVSGQPIALVQSVWLHILVSASESTERGAYSIAEESISSALDEAEEKVTAIISSMQGRVLSGKQVINWERRQPNRDEDGNSFSYIYYVGTTDSDVVKIGISKNPWARVKDLQTGSPSKFELLAALKTNERSEVDIHRFFKLTRKTGEWFSRSNALNTLINKISSKEITTHIEATEFLKSLPIEDFTPSTVATTYTTKDKDKIKIREDKKVRQQGSRFALTEFPDDWKKFCLEKRPDLNPEELFAEFGDYWRGVPGARGRKLDWEATWRNRVRDKKKESHTGNGKTAAFKLSGPAKPLSDAERLKNIEWAQEKNIPLTSEQQIFKANYEARNQPEARHA